MTLQLQLALYVTNEQTVHTNKCQAIHDIYNYVLYQLYTGCDIYMYVYTWDILLSVSVSKLIYKLVEMRWMPPLLENQNVKKKCKFPLKTSLCGEIKVSREFDVRQVLGLLRIRC